jgi:hypothetical protein
MVIVDDTTNNFAASTPITVSIEYNRKNTIFSNEHKVG